MTLHERWIALLESGQVQWMAGMLATDQTWSWRIFHDGIRLWAVANDPLPEARGSLRPDRALVKTVPEHAMCPPGVPWEPVWKDPGTVGCLLTMTREAWGEREIYVEPVGGARWRVYQPVTHGIASLGGGTTESAALLAALEAAPLRRLFLDEGQHKQQE